MKNLILNVVAAALFVLPVASIAGDGHEGHEKMAAKDKVKLQATCPVMGGKINKDLFVDHDGQRIYVCCKGCIGKVKANPGKYIKKLAAKGETVAKLQTTCPVTGEAVDNTLFVDHDGQRIYVCCKGCIAKVKKDPATYVAKLAAKGEIPHSIKDTMKKKMHMEHMEGSHHK